MDIDYTEIENRLAASFTHGARIVFWEDEAGEHAQAIPELHVEGAEVVDATKRELATKRLVMRERQSPEDRFVIYRAGPVPAATDDLMLDIKLAARPFTCSMEGVWADECGIPATLAPTLTDHAAFFKSKERRGALAACELPKDDPSALRFAMAASLLRSRDVEPRDAARSMARRAIEEWARGDERSMRLLEEAGLTSTFWSAMERYVGYRVPDAETPSVGDLAFRLLEGRLGAIVEDAGRANEAESVRILNDLAYGKGRDAYDRIVDEYASAVASLVPEDAKTIELLEGIDAIPQIDEWILELLAGDSMSSELAIRRAGHIWAARSHNLFAKRFEPYYRFVIAIGSFGKECRAYKDECGAGVDLQSVLERYCASWHKVDRRYREAILAYRRMPAGTFKTKMEDAVSKMLVQYDTFLMDITDRWQMHLLDEGTWPPASTMSQDRFFREYVEKEFPRAEKGKRIGIIVSDALRYEAGRDLAGRFTASKAKELFGRTEVTCEHMLGMIPSYTQLGMAALLPEGPLRIDPATTGVTKGGVPTKGTENRGKILSGALAGAVTYKAASVLESTKLDLGEAPVAVVYHNVIDKTGDESETENKVFEAVEQACAEIERLARTLVRAGCGRVIITSDHGFLYQAQNPAAYAYADIPWLSDMKSDESLCSDYTRRFIVGQGLPRHESLIVYTAAQLSLDGDYEVGIPKGVTRLRLRGSGARFVHGGASLQENVIPVITLKVAKGSFGSRPTRVEGFPTGRTVITGPMASLTVYQHDPCSNAVSPLTVKVGAYGPDGALVSSTEKTLNLESDSADAEQRRVQVTLPLLDEVDNYKSIFLRILKRVGDTNAFEVAWEQEYTVTRAFDMDF